MNLVSLTPRETVPVGELVDVEAHVRQLGFLTPDDAARLDAIEHARYVLVRMDQGERWRCRECGGKHEFFTRFCVPRPWHGLREGLYAYVQNVGGARPSDLSPAQLARLRAIVPRVGLAGPLPNLADGHPWAAAALATPSGDVEYVAWLLGSVVEITEAQARRYAATINARARRTVVRL